MPSPSPVRRLLLVRKNNVTADLVEKTGLTPFVKGKPIPITPCAWRDEDGLSHWGYVLEGLKLEDLEMLSKWHNERPNDTIVDLGEDAEETLKGIGLRVNALAE